MGKPFKVNETPKTNTNEVKPLTQPDFGAGIIHSQKTGEPLPDGSKDSMREPRIPWPEPVLGVDHVPYKNTTKK
jgi:hypothetical protein